MSTTRVQSISATIFVLVFLVVASCLSAWTTASHIHAADAHESGLVGTWNLLGAEHDGVKRELDFASDQWVFEGREFTRAFVKKDGRSGGGTSRYLTDSSKNPKEVTIVGPHLAIQAIYRLENDQLTIAHYGKPENVRPLGFTPTTAGSTGHVLIVWTFKRK